MKKILIICGPTAVGKTSLAFSLAKKFHGEIISSDSRQIYKGMDIGTGKDLPTNAKYSMSHITLNNKPVGYYACDTTRIWGLDLVNPKEEFNVSDYIVVARNVIHDIWKRGKLPILVGGTGFYIKGVVVSETHTAHSAFLQVFWLDQILLLFP